MMNSESSLLSKFALSKSSQSQGFHAIPKDKINQLILNYFIQEGFGEAAQSFAKEAPMHKEVSSVNRNFSEITESQSNGDIKSCTTEARGFMGSLGNQTQIAPKNRALNGISTIDKRKQIKYLILKGEITTAIDEISANFPSVLDSNNFLFFKLLRLNLIEMIREHNYGDPNPTADIEQVFLEKVITFVRENMVAKVFHSTELLKELEITMSLLCFDFDPEKQVTEMRNLPDQLKKLFDVSLRSECYRAVNKAILELEYSVQQPPQYQGMSFKDFSGETLRKLPLAVSYEDLGDQEDSLADVEKLVNLISSEEPKGNSPTTDETKVSPEELTSQLERIAALWIATENKMIDQKLIKRKRYEDLLSDKIML